MDEDMEGKTHTERQTETETERIWSGLVQLSLDNNNNNNNNEREREREREREISNTRRRGELDRGPHPPARPKVALLPGGGSRKRPNTSLYTEDQIGSGVLTHTHTRLCYSVFLVFSLTMLMLLLFVDTNNRLRF